MARLLYIFVLAIFCTACDTKTSSTPNTSSTETTPESPSGATSIAGVTPGKTTLEELRNLVTNPEKVENRGSFFVDLKGLDGRRATVHSENGVVYKVQIPIGLVYRAQIPVGGSGSVGHEAIRIALTEKYGTPKIKKGGIKEVTCQNKLGGSFQRLEGEEFLLWKPNEGTQAYFYRYAYECEDYFVEEYILEHIATVQKLEAAKEAERTKRMSDQVDKVRAGL